MALCVYSLITFEKGKHTTQLFILHCLVASAKYMCWTDFSIPYQRLYIRQSLLYQSLPVYWVSLSFKVIDSNYRMWNMPDLLVSFKSIHSLLYGTLWIETKKNNFQGQFPFKGVLCWRLCSTKADGYKQGMPSLFQKGNSCIDLLHVTPRIIIQLP